MKGDDKVSILAKRHGPVVWGLSLVVGVLAGGGVVSLVRVSYGDGGGPVMRVWMVAPFVVLLASIAVMPLVAPRVWHRHFPDFALGLGGLVVGYYLAGFGGAPGFARERI